MTTTGTWDTYDVCVAKYSSSGSLAWAQNYGGTSNDFGNGVAVDSGGSPIVTGSFSLTGLDCFLMKLNP